MSYLTFNRDKDRERSLPFFHCFYAQNRTALLPKRPNNIENKDETIFDSNIACSSQMTPIPVCHEDSIQNIEVKPKSNGDKV